MRFGSTAVTALLAAALSFGCGGDKEEAPGTAAGQGPSAAAEKPSKTKKPQKDRGEAAMTLGGVDWTAERAKAKLNDKRLIIRASRTDVDGKAVKRQELHLQVDDYAGPGDYVTGISGSRFIGVGIDTQAAKAAEGDDEAASKMATDAISKAKHMMLMKATVTITSASDSEISGTFAWQPPKGLDKPAITGGSFRAIIDK